MIYIKMPVEFGKEDTSFVTNEVIRKMIISHYRGIQRLIQFIYFNDDYPNNQTIRYNPKDNHELFIFEDGEFVSASKEYVLDTIIFNAWRKYIDYYESLERAQKVSAFKNSLVCQETFDRINHFVDTYRKICNGDFQPVIKDLRNDVMDMIKANAALQKKKEIHASRSKKKKNTTGPI
jgi:hypothetical protein